MDARAEKQKRKRKGLEKKGVEEKRGKNGGILGEPYLHERKEEREERRSTRTTSKKCSNINSPRQFMQ